MQNFPDNIVLTLSETYYKIIIAIPVCVVNRPAAQNTILQYTKKNERFNHWLFSLFGVAENKEFFEKSFPNLWQNRCVQRSR